MTSATLGALILWLGWFGFNPGSTMAVDPNAIALVALNTNMAAAAGALSSTVAAWLALGKPDLSMIINGTLAGLVAITAPCAFVGVGSSIVIGLVAGVLVVYAVLFFDRVKIDDPVGALSVHLVNGAFGTLCVGLFAKDGGLFFGGGFAKTTHAAHRDWRGRRDDVRPVARGLVCCSRRRWAFGCRRPRRSKGSIRASTEWRPTEDLR